MLVLYFGRIGIWKCWFFFGGRKTGEPGEKPSEQGREPTTNSINRCNQAGIKPGPYWWETGALTSAPSLLPRRHCNYEEDGWKAFRIVFEGGHGRNLLRMLYLEEYFFFCFKNLYFAKRDLWKNHFYDSKALAVSSRLLKRSEIITNGWDFGATYLSNMPWYLFPFVWEQC